MEFEVERAAAVAVAVAAEQGAGLQREEQEKQEVEDEIIGAAQALTADAELGTNVDDVAEEEEDEDEEEDEGETRCVCGEVDPPDGSGLYIQCEQCSVWQHGYCVGIGEGEDTSLEKYWCERCKPELHQLYVEDATGRTRSIYKPVQEKRRRNRRSNRHGKGSGSAVGEDANEDDEKPALAQLQGLAEAPGTALMAVATRDGSNGTSSNSTSSSRPRSSRGGYRAPSGEDLKGNAATDSSSNSNSNEKTNADHWGGSESFVFHLDDDKRLQDRKRATFSAREEKQYQLMLERAIQESRRTSHQEDSDSPAEGRPEDPTGLPAEQRKAKEIEADVLAQHEADRALSPVTQGPSTEFSRTDNYDHRSFPEPAHDRAVNDVIESSASPPPGKQHSHSHSSNSTSDDDLKRNNGTKRSQGGPKSGRRGKSAGSSRSSAGRNKNSINTPPNNKTDIGISKPMKPRLPPQRTTLSEMRRRVSAIIEFISRTQWELSEEHSSKDDLVRFVENQQFVDQVDHIFEKYDQSFKLMDDLTRSLLLWEKKYSNSSSIND